MTPESFTIEPKNKNFELFCYLPEKELHSPGLSVTFSSLVDLSQIDRCRRAAIDPAHRISYTAYVAKALAQTLSEIPYANRRVFHRPWLPFARRRLVTFTSNDIAIAVERDSKDHEFEAFVEVLRGADQLPLQKIRDWLRRLANGQTEILWNEFTKLTRSKPTWLVSFMIRWPCWSPKLWTKHRGAAAIISSPGKYGVDSISAVWAWPLGVSFGHVKERAFVKDGELKVAPSFYLTVNFDRRIMAGGPAARFFHRLVELLENPSELS